MTGTSEWHDAAQAALWREPAYANLPTGREIRQIIQVLRKIYKERPPTEVSSSEGLDSFRVYGSICSQLEQLMIAPETDDLGRVRPATGAVTQAKHRLFLMANSLVLPQPEDVGTDRDGAIRISWRREGRFLELIFPYEIDVRPYIYYSEGTVFDISEDLSPSKLHGWARWLEGAARPK